MRALYNVCAKCLQSTMWTKKRYTSHERCALILGGIPRICRLLWWIRTVSPTISISLFINYNSKAYKMEKRLLLGWLELSNYHVVFYYRSCVQGIPGRLEKKYTTTTPTMIITITTTTATAIATTNQQEQKCILSLLFVISAHID